MIVTMHVYIVQCDGPHDKMGPVPSFPESPFFGKKDVLRANARAEGWTFVHVLSSEGSSPKECAYCPACAEVWKEE